MPYSVPLAAKLPTDPATNALADATDPATDPATVDDALGAVVERSLV
jgi:hypothetical protein